MKFVWNNILPTWWTFSRRSLYTWLHTWDHTITHLRSHDYIPEITWLHTWDHMITYLRSHDYIPEITWLHTWDHMITYLRSLFSMSWYLLVSTCICPCSSSIRITSVNVHHKLQLPNWIVAQQMIENVMKHAI